MEKNFNLLKEEYYHEYRDCTSMFDCDQTWIPSCDVCSFYKHRPTKDIKSIDEAKNYVNEEFIIENPNTFQRANVILNEDYDFYIADLGKDAVYCNIAQLKLGIEKYLYVIK